MTRVIAVVIILAILFLIVWTVTRAISKARARHRELEAVWEVGSHLRGDGWTEVFIERNSESDVRAELPPGHTDEDFTDAVMSAKLYAEQVNALKIKHS